MFWEILKASKGLPVADQYAALWGKKIAEAGGWKVTEITGELPLIFRADGSVLVDYRIYGTSEGAGVETENLWDKDDPSMRMFGYINAQTKVVTASVYMSLSIIAPVLPNTDYTISKLSTSRFRVGEFSSYPQMGDIATVVHGDRDNPSGTDRGTILSFTTSSSTTYIFAFVRNYDDPVTIEELINSIMVTKGSTPPDHYIPHGYKLPLTVESGEQSQDIPIYIGSTKLGTEEYIDYGEQKVYKMSEGALVPTDPPAPLPAINAYKGENTLSSTETLGEVTVKGRIKEADS